MKCHTCNSNLDNDAVFCPDCGAFLIKSTPEKEITLTIGRAKENSIHINHPKVSSKHAHIKLINGVFMIEDLDSSNGVFVNKKKITICRVTNNDEILLGNDCKLNWDVINSAVAKSSGSIVHTTSKEQRVNKDLSSKNIITIGRGSDNDIVINNVKSSRHHAQIKKFGEDWVIEDFESANGTFVNGKKIKKQTITAQDKIIIAGIPLDLESIFFNEEIITGDIKISIQDLSFIVDGKTIVENIGLTILPGEFVGLIGPSGAGKTTLMMMMNGVTKPSLGKVYINDQSLYDNFDSFKGQIGYVPQDDIIHRELKVEESLTYTAKLRFNKFSSTEISDQVNNVINTLDLTEAKTTLIGTAEKKGISGGQRKRVNLGQELLTEPSILFLDEPTSGLDPKSDHDVMNLLQEITNKGKIVVLTTHNITKENFEILTHLIVLTKGGKLAYFGHANKATSYFEVDKPFQIFDKLKGEQPDFWKRKYQDSQYYKTFVKDRSDNNSAVLIKETTGNFTQSREANFSQLFILTQRYLKIKVRDKISTLILLLQAPIIAMLVSLVFGKPDEKTQAVFILVIAAIWLGCSNAARELVSEQSIFKRERMVNLKIPSYLFSKMFVLSLLCLVQSLILVGTVSITLDLSGNFFQLFVILLLTSISSLSIGLFISSIVSTNEAAMGLIPIVLIPQVILGGLISTFGNMKEFVKLLAGLMLSRWSFEAVLISEFKGNQSFAISQIGFNLDNLLIDILVIILFNLVFLYSTAQILKRKK